VEFNIIIGLYSCSRSWTVGYCEISGRRSVSSVQCLFLVF